MGRESRKALISLKRVADLIPALAMLEPVGGGGEALRRSSGRVQPQCGDHPRQGAIFAHELVEECSAGMEQNKREHRDVDVKMQVAQMGDARARQHTGETHAEKTEVKCVVDQSAMTACADEVPCG